MIRFRSQRRSSSLDRLDLYLLWPEMAGYSEAMKEEFNRTTINPAILFLTIEPRTMSQDMTGRIPAIYAKFMEGPETDAGFGLKRRALSAEGGFGGEELWYEAEQPLPLCRALREAGRGFGHALLPARHPCGTGPCRHLPVPPVPDRGMDGA